MGIIKDNVTAVIVGYFALILIAFGGCGIIAHDIFTDSKKKK